MTACETKMQTRLQLLALLLLRGLGPTLHKNGEAVVNVVIEEETCCSWSSKTSAWDSESCSRRLCSSALSAAAAAAAAEDEDEDDDMEAPLARSSCMAIIVARSCCTCNRAVTSSC